MSRFSMQAVVNEICRSYDAVVRVVDSNAQDDEERAYGGVVRAVKGKLVEYTAEQIIKAAWQKVGGNASRLKIDSKKIPVRIQKRYVAAIQDAEIKAHIQSNISKYRYNISVDKHVYIDNKLVMGIECKAYAENAMMKRILFDFSLLKTRHPQMSCYLFQLESQLGGDYSALNAKTFGSPSTHTLQSYFDAVTLNIHTFVKGERKPKQPIHEHKYYKPINKDKLKEAINCLAEDLRQYK